MLNLLFMLLVVRLLVFYQKALAEAEWKAKIAEASAYDELDCSGAGPAMEQGWDAEEQAVLDAEDRHGDWFAEIANQRRQLR